MKLSRRDFLHKSGTLGALTALSSLNVAAAPLFTRTSNDARPNVLFIAVDDLNDWIGELKGHPQAKTPNIDRLMQSATTFTNAHCAIPVCGPSRNAILTGMRPSTTGWYTNKELGMKHFDAIAENVLGDIPTLPQHFKACGYTTMAGGKIFHHGTSDYRAKQQWDSTLTPYAITGEDAHLLKHGFGYGDYGVSDHKYYPFPVGGGQIIEAFGADSKPAGISLAWGALEPEDIPHNGVMPDEYAASWAINQLAQSYDAPFFLGVGFVRPHLPYTAPKRYFDAFPLDDIIMPEILPGEMDDIPLYGKAMALGVIPGGDHAAIESISPTFWKEMVRANLACIAFVDDQIGRVLDALESSAYRDNTIVVLWGDHGQNFGEHRNWRKMSLWEESTRVPLVIRQPKQTKGQRCEQAVSLLDLYPTLVDLCGLPEVPSNEGLSLKVLLNNPEFERKMPAVTTWGYQNHAVRDERWRYIRYRDGSEELYDHTVDPNEHHNLALGEQYHDIKQALAAWIPSHNVLPYGMKDFSQGDFLEARIQQWQETGIPEFLGKVPHR